MGRYFGTDGIRGLAGRFPLTPQNIRRFGAAAGLVLHEKFPQEKIRILAVRDTRESGAWILKSLAEGLFSQGVDVYDAGVLSTPSVAYLVKAHRFQSGVVISASHNPPPFNGIKFFNPYGYKWPDPWEAEVEKIFDSRAATPKTKEKGRWLSVDSYREDYEEFLESTLEPGLDFSGLRVAVDCSNGSNSVTAPDLLKDLKAQIFIVGNHPNGANINVGCGSQSTQKLKELVKKQKCHVGIAFDGDGDRVIMVDEKGGLVDGDHLIALLAHDLLRKGLLKKKTVVITVMANLGLKKALQKMGVKIVETAVGDRHVAEAMKHHSAVLGGEQSGHVILGQYLPSGDGLLTSLHVLSILKKARQKFSSLVGGMTKYPQVLLNMTVKEKKPLDHLPTVQKKIHHVEKILGTNGRLLVRYSGTEPLLRIMLEGPHEPNLHRLANEIADEAKAVLL